MTKNISIKIILKIMVFITLFFMIFNNYVYASSGSSTGLPTLGDDYRPTVSITGDGSSRFEQIIIKLLNFLTVLGICVIVVATAMVGFDSMLGSANQKAVAKEKYIGLIIAAVVLVAGSILAKVVINIAEGI